MNRNRVAVERFHPSEAGFNRYAVADIFQDATVGYVRDAHFTHGYCCVAPDGANRTGERREHAIVSGGNR